MIEEDEDDDNEKFKFNIQKRQIIKTKPNQLPLPIPNYQLPTTNYQLPSITLLLFIMLHIYIYSSRTWATFGRQSFIVLSLKTPHVELIIINC